MSLHVDELAQEIRCVDGAHSLGAGALAEALMPYLRAALAGGGEAVAWEVQGHDGEWGFMHPSDLDYYRRKGIPTRPLYTHPASAERAESAEARVRELEAQRDSEHE